MENLNSYGQEGWNGFELGDIKLSSVGLFPQHLQVNTHSFEALALKISKEGAEM